MVWKTTMIKTTLSQETDLILYQAYSIIFILIYDLALTTDFGYENKFLKNDFMYVLKFYINFFLEFN